MRLTPQQYEALSGAAPQAARGSLVLNDTVMRGDDTLECPVCAPAQARALAYWAEHYAALAGSSNPAQLPALLFDATGDPWPLAHYFPRMSALAAAARADLIVQMSAVAGHPHLDLRLIGERQTDQTTRLPASARWLVAGHLVEVLGERTDILDAFLAQPRHIRLYTSGQAFADDGGVAGGDYDAERERIQLGLGRLFEGFSGPRPGVAPFLHELGHMLDAFDAATGTMGRGRGLLPGLDLRDGPLFDAEARRLFIQGKTLEARRYADRRSKWGGSPSASALPIGHPYVFQNDGEFIAGYLELFFRTPHRFASLNPDLYAAFSGLLRQDTRPFWPEDFAYYVRENEAAYLPGKPLAPAGITVPNV